ncbi:MAG TPA: SAM-dependent chlorinase/fluorinase, partial [Deferrisomatales bacterium]|nr:SAM-dependent chlorinase/fluorinase [Deferrisomatales bacterium]
MKTNTVNLGPAPPSVNPTPLITLTTDFGLADPYVGVMKGVILSRCPSARLVDLTHHVPPQDVLVARLALEDAHPFFPAGTLHVAVVDPGVGTPRAVLWARTTAARFLAPDNGLLS